MLYECYFHLSNLPQNHLSYGLYVLLPNGKNVLPSGWITCVLMLGDTSFSLDLIIQKYDSSCYNGIYLQTLYTIGSYWTSYRHMFLYHIPTILFSSIKAMLLEPYLHTVPKVDVPFIVY